MQFGRYISECETLSGGGTDITKSHSLQDVINPERGRERERENERESKVRPAAEAFSGYPSCCSQQLTEVDPYFSLC